MPVPGPYVIVLSAGEEAVLAARARSARSEYRDRLRAQIVLAAAAGRATPRSPCRRECAPDTVRKWRRRFAADGLPGLRDAPRSGRPPVFTAADRAEAVALACALPAVLDLYAGTWDGGPLGSNDYVICADEKPSIQARCRCRPTLPPGKA